MYVPLPTFCVTQAWGVVYFFRACSPIVAPRPAFIEDLLSSLALIFDLLLYIPGKENYLYLGAIAFIKSLKKGAAFGECCPMLNDIAQLPSWKKVNTGMQRLYEGKILVYVVKPC